MNDSAIRKNTGDGRLTRRLVAGRVCERVPYRTVRKHGRADWLLTFTIRGVGVYRSGEVKLEAMPGDLVLLAPHAFHDYGCRSGRVWEFLWVHFYARSQWEEMLTFSGVAPGLTRLHVRNAQIQKRIRMALSRCVGDARGVAEGMDADLAMNALEEVLLLGAREQQFTQRPKPLSEEIRRVIEYLSEKYMAQQAVPELARLARLSPSRFAHRFKEETGASVIVYLNRIRIQEAARLLEFSGRTIQEIASLVGFECPFYFSRTFRKAFNQSPRDFRNLHR